MDRFQGGEPQRRLAHPVLEEGAAAAGPQVLAEGRRRRPLRHQALGRDPLRVLLGGGGDLTELFPRKALGGGTV